MKHNTVAMKHGNPGHIRVNVLHVGFLPKAYLDLLVPGIPAAIRSYYSQISAEVCRDGLILAGIHPRGVRLREAWNRSHGAQQNGSEQSLQPCMRGSSKITELTVGRGNVPRRAPPPPPRTSRQASALLDKAAPCVQRACHLLMISPPTSPTWRG